MGSVTAENAVLTSLGFPGTALKSALTMPAQQAIDGGGFLDSECPRSGSEQIHWVAQCKEHTLDWHQLAGGTCYNLAPPRGLAVLVCATANAIDRQLAALIAFPGQTSFRELSPLMQSGPCQTDSFGILSRVQAEIVVGSSFLKGGSISLNHDGMDSFTFSLFQRASKFVCCFLEK